MLKHQGGKSIPEGRIYNGGGVPVRQRKGKSPSVGAKKESGKYELRNQPLGGTEDQRTRRDKLASRDWCSLGLWEKGGGVTGERAL